MREEITLVFGDGTRFQWRTWKIRDSIKAIKMQKKHGDPIEIIGDGTVANTLRDKYAKYNKNPSEYKSDVFGTASKLSGVAKQDLEAKFGKIKNRILRRR